MLILNQLKMSAIRNFFYHLKIANFLILYKLCLIIFLVSIKSTTHASINNEYRELYRGIYFIGKPVNKKIVFDITPAHPLQVLDSMKKAIDILLTKSSYNAKAIQQLKKKGKIVIVYDANHPKHNLTELTIASFLPDYYQESGPIKNFVVIIGRYGGKWSARDLAPVMAHELAGHGIQRLQKRLKKVRNIDLECQAYLYQEKAYQDLGYDKNHQEMVNFRQKLEKHWCSDFKLWIAEKASDKLSLWHTKNPNVPKLLKLFNKYSISLENLKVTRKAVQAAEANQSMLNTGKLQRLINSKESADHYELGLKYLTGVGVPINIPNAIKWLEKAAKGGNPRAQKTLADVLFKGIKGQKKDLQSAIKLYKEAASKNLASAQTALGVIFLNGHGVPRDVQKGRAFLIQAKKNGSKIAKTKLNQLKRINIKNLSEGK